MHRTFPRPWMTCWTLMILLMPHSRRKSESRLRAPWPTATLRVSRLTTEASLQAGPLQAALHGAVWQSILIFIQFGNDQDAEASLLWNLM